MDRNELLKKAVEQTKTAVDDIAYMNDCEGPAYEPSVEVCVELIRLQKEAHRLLHEINRALVVAHEADVTAAHETVKAMEPKARRNPWAHAE
ncbi:MAG: hypothetical protein ACLP4V_25465 [Methylocella sp.]